MTDKEKWIAFLKDMDIEFKDSGELSHRKGSILRFTEGQCNVGGYVGFFTEIEFDIDGKFEVIGAWE